MYIIIIYIYSITDMCCCQLAAAVAHLLPVLNSPCLCFVAPKQGPDSWPKNGATILKWIAQLPNLWSNFGPMVYAFCLLQRARWAATGCIFHSCFLALGARMLVSHAEHRVKEGKKHAGPQPQKWARVAAQAKGTFQKVQGCKCCSAASMRGWLPQAKQRHVYSQRQCTGPYGRNPRHPQTSKLTCFGTLQSSYTRKGSKTGFCERQRWFLGSRAMFACAYPHTSRGSSVKLEIRVGSAEKLHKKMFVPKIKK